MSQEPNQSLASAQEARQVAEAARETEWKKRSFARGLFEGRLDLHLVHPLPDPTPEQEAKARPFLKALEEFCIANIDGDAIDRERWVPQEVLDGLAELGAFGIKIPEEYGGLGLSQYHYNKALGLVASRCASTGAFLSAHQSIGVPQPLIYFGTEAQKKKYLPRLAGGELSAFALTERHVGSDPANLSTTAELLEDGQHWILNGEKLWCTNGPRADIIVVMARTPAREGVPQKRPISAFIVETSWEGVEAGHVCTFLGLNGLSNGVLHFDNVKVPTENLLWREGRGLKLALITLNTGRLSIPAFCAVGAKGALLSCRQWASERFQWGAPIGKHDAIAQKLGTMAASTFALDAVVDLTARMADAKSFDIRLEAAIAKMWNSETSYEVIDGRRPDSGRPRLREGRLAASPWRAPVPDRARAPGQQDQPHLRGFQRDHASLHRPGGGRQPPERGRRHDRSQGAESKAHSRPVPCGTALCVVVSKPLAHLGTLAAVPRVRAPRSPPVLRAQDCRQAGSVHLLCHGALRPRARAEAGGPGEDRGDRG